jgi:hypothetical protein
MQLDRNISCSLPLLAEIMEILLSPSSFFHDLPAFLPSILPCGRINGRSFSDHPSQEDKLTIFHDCVLYAKDGWTAFWLPYFPPLAKKDVRACHFCQDEM